MCSLEHWDVNNENLHGQWFQERLHDRDYDLELFRMMYQADPYPKLFLNDYNVVAQGAATSVRIDWLIDWLINWLNFISQRGRY